MHTTCRIPGHTTLSYHAQNSWVYCQQSCNHHMTVVLGTQILPRNGTTFLHMLTYSANLHALSQDGQQGRSHPVLQYSGVLKIRESEARLVRNCTKR